MDEADGPGSWTRQMEEPAEPAESAEPAEPGEPAEAAELLRLRASPTCFAYVLRLRISLTKRHSAYTHRANL